MVWPFIFWPFDRNKYRVYIAIFTLQAISHIPERRHQDGSTGYHWGFFIMHKYQDEGWLFELLNQPGYVNVEGSRGWVYQFPRFIHPFQLRSVLGYILIGKLPKRLSLVDIHKTLWDVPYPRGYTIPKEDIIPWLRRAIAALQARRIAENFDFDEFLTWAVAKADEWNDIGERLPRHQAMVCYPEVHRKFKWP